MKCAMASEDPEIIGRAKDVCESIDIMVGHTARISNQERYWPDMLNKLKSSMDYNQVLLKSDYWKKFEGTVMKQGESRIHSTLLYLSPPPSPPTLTQKNARVLQSNPLRRTAHGI